MSVDDRSALRSFVEPLERLGHLFAPDPAFPRFHFFGRPASRPRSHHVHVCSAGHDEIRHLAVRDSLRAHPDEVVRYGGLERRVGSRHPRDRLAYIERKGPLPGRAR